MRQVQQIPYMFGRHSRESRGEAKPTWLDNQKLQRTSGHLPRMQHQEEERQQAIAVKLHRIAKQAKLSESQRVPAHHSKAGEASHGQSQPVTAKQAKLSLSQQVSVCQSKAG